MRYLWLLPLLLLAACGIASTDVEREPGGPLLAGADVDDYNIYLIKDDRLSPVIRRGYAGQDGFAFEQLRLGPTEAEKRQGYRSELPETPMDIGLGPKGAMVHPVDGSPWSKLAKAQVACTLTSSFTGDPELSIKLPDPGPWIPIKCDI